MHGCSSATAAERELYRYHDPELAAAISLKFGDGPKTSLDPCLTSFAQLGALRLNARRGIISLSTRTSEYILAEAGQTLSLQQENDQNDKLWHGVGTLRDNEGVGPDLVNDFQDVRTAPACIVINDLLEHEQFKHKKIVSTSPCVRFLAAVPLRTPYRSTVIGTVLVVDDKPRQGLNEQETQYLVDLAVTVMEYLEAGRTKQKHYRAERMVKALGLFVEGKSTLRDWWLQGGHNIQPSRIQRAAAHGIKLTDRADMEFGVQDPPDFSSMQGIEILQQSSLIDPESASTVPSTYALSEKDLHSTESVSESAANTTIETNGEAADAAAAGSDTSFNEVPSKLQEALVSPDVKDVFGRASSLIRESTSVDGVVFYDASVGSFGGRSGKGTGAIVEKAPGEFHINGDHEGPTSSSDDDQSRGKDEENPHREEHAKMSNILGYSTRTRSSLKSHYPSESLRSFPEKVIRRLLKRYPHGKVFNFDKDGSFSSSDSDGNTTGNDNLQPPKPISNGRKIKKKMSREQEAAAILAVLPGARSVMWFPLWDQTKERWFSGSFIWSTRCNRVLCPTEDLTYMAAFGNSVMSEVSRLAALSAAQMKTDFISSISHELRSPLHGVLASVEFLQETEMTEMQADMVSNISSSGKVLLDTINHVLDFSKVNRKLKEKRRKPHRGGKRSKSHSKAEDSVSKEDLEDVYRLSTEVITSVYAGRNMGKLAQEASGGRRPKLDRADSSQTPVMVIVDAPCRLDFMVEIDAGAWRRILMNLFSNALKYTSKGFVRIKFALEELPPVQGQRARHQLILKVTDSGKGISQEFLRHQLYKPFAQEDSLAVGTGLGVSIVRQIVQDMGGDIQITSEQGSGTEARVRLPLVMGHTGTINPSMTIHAEVCEKVKGITTKFFGFDRYPEISETPTGILSAESEAVLLLKSSVKHIMRDWFDIVEAPDSAIPDSQIDLQIILESGFSDEALEQKISSFKEARAHATTRTMVMVLSNSLQKRNHINSKGFTVNYVPLPFGPLRYMQALHAGFVKAFNESDEEPPTKNSPEIVNGNAGQAKPNNLENMPPIPTLSVSIAPPTPPHTAELPKVSPFAADIQAKSPKVDVAPCITDGMRVLLVEDNEINLKLLVTYMRKLKISYATATNGLEALNAYKEANGQFDIIFMDISMPVMSGIESTRHIRTFEGENTLQPVALIALTGAANPAARQEAFASGIDLFLTKPVPMRSLKTLLEDFKIKGKEDWQVD
ncbi:hypothetical protein BP5796_07556 [Coleophoma crateriformis]|uniref:Uncharacterized protein n=1 Tax=Coleophoma crateriformis TaxID=565419 RepID=A0A3D8RJN8_9HELO|nr:hypothetical protein BP5796_07556 [Coleophoma crateriformis]